jgi:hypothetical protein
LWDLEIDLASGAVDSVLLLLIQDQTQHFPNSANAAENAGLGFILFAAFTLKDFDAWPPLRPRFLVVNDRLPEIVKGHA